MKVIDINNMYHKFGDNLVIDNLSFSLNAGEVLGFFGHNGAGKTTTMKIILGLLKPTDGSVRVFGQKPNHLDFSHHRYRIGFLPENVSFYQQLTGLEVLRFFAKLKRVSVARCQELIDQVGLSDASGRKVKKYSKGMKQRLGLAQALLTEPSLLILDEPTVGLDPIATQEFYLTIDRLKNNGCSIILCSHVLPSVEKHIDKVAILSKGCLAAYGSIQALREETCLPTKIIFSGCFNMERLEKMLPNKLFSNEDGTFSFFVEEEQKLDSIRFLLSLPGIQNLNTYPASLEMLYKHYLSPKPLDWKTKSSNSHTSISSKPSVRSEELL